MTRPAIAQPAGMIRRTERGTRITLAIVGAVLTMGAGHLALLRMGESLVSLSYDMPFIVHRPGVMNDLRIVYLNKLNDEMLDRAAAGPPARPTRRGRRQGGGV